MRVFITGASGFVGSAVIPELLRAGHQVLGLARSDRSAAVVAATGAEVHRGDLEDLDSLRRGAEVCDGVIHAGFIHEFDSNFSMARFQEVCAIDRRAIGALGEALIGSDRPLVVTSGVGIGDPGNGGPATEDITNTAHPNPRTASELAVDALVEQGVRASVVRLPQVHDTHKQGLVTFVINLAREKGRVAFIGEGANRWAAVHVLDAAQVYRLALEQGTAGGRYHPVAEEGVSARAIAEAVGRGLKVPVVSLSPEEAGAHFGWFTFFAGMDIRASSALTQERLGWRPTQTATLIDDLNAMDYSAA